MTSGIFLLTGTNLGDREANLNLAKRLIDEKAGAIVRCSDIYQSAAWGNTQQPAFLNQVVEIQTAHSPHALLAQCLQIEETMGRQRLEHWGARVIDIDILFYSNEIVVSETLAIPHPQIAFRKFTLMPLNEIAADMIHPILQKKISELLAQCPDQLAVEKLRRQP